MNNLLRWLQFWLNFALLLLIIYLLNKQTLLIFMGPMGIINGYFISNLLEQYKKEWTTEGISKGMIKVYCIPYYLYYICTIIGSVWFFMEIL